MSAHLKFLRNLQRVLDEGTFTATYKYALLLSLADLSVERRPESDGSMRIPVSVISEKFIDYYWFQTVPYRGTDGILRQNSGKQAAIVNHVAETRAKYAGKIGAARQNQAEWTGLRSRVASIVRQMPLWKLQVVGGRNIEFLYRRDQYEGGAVRVLPEAVRCFREMHVIISNFIRGAWVARLQAFASNQHILGESARLSEFLFGSDRVALDNYRDVLQEYQQSRCFYCGRAARDGDLDHFVPWSRYPVDLGHNFVFSHASCNRSKRDLLAHSEHLAKWCESNVENAKDLTEMLRERNLIQDVSRSRHVAIWAYEQGEASGSYGWVAGDRLEKLGNEWRKILL